MKYNSKNVPIRDYKFNRERDKFLAHVFPLEKAKGFVLENNVPFRVDFYEVFFITEGEGFFILDSEKTSIKRNSVLCLPPSKVRRWEMKVPPKGYALIFEEEFFSGYFNDSLFIHRFNIFNNVSLPFGLTLNDNDFSLMQENIIELINERKNLNWDSPHLFRAIFYLLLTKINREYVNVFGIKTEIYANNLIIQFKLALSENIKQFHRVEDYARILNISRTHLNTVLKKAMGKTPNTVIKEYLISKIKSEILYTNKSISEIAFDFNFSDTSNFHRLFLKMTGYKPNEFKAMFSK